MNLYEAIYTRQSIRNYKMEELDSSLLQNLLSYAKQLTMLEETIKVKYYLINSFTYPKSFHRFTVHAPYYLTLFSDTNGSYLENAGYLLEQIALYLTTKEIGTCFLGTIIKPSNLETTHLKPILSLAFGKSKKESIYRDVKKINRLPFHKLCVFKEDTDCNIKRLLQAARIAPSSFNQQPWRFVVYNNRIHIFCKKPVFSINSYQKMQKINMGIMLANLLLKAEDLWLDVSLQTIENMAEKTFQKNEYYITLKINS